MKRCFHKDLDLVLIKVSSRIDSCVGHACKNCGAVRDSVLLGSPWRKGNKTELINQLIDKYSPKPSEEK